MRKEFPRQTGPNVAQPNLQADPAHSSQPNRAQRSHAESKSRPQHNPVKRRPVEPITAHYSLVLPNPARPSGAHSLTLSDAFQQSYYSRSKSAESSPAESVLAKHSLATNYSPTHPSTSQVNSIQATRLRSS